MVGFVRREILHLHEPVKFFLLNFQTPSHSHNFLFARGWASIELGGVDGSRIYEFLQGVFIWFSQGFRYFSVISITNPLREKKTRSPLLAGKSIYGRKPKWITANQTKLSNFHVVSLHTKRVRAQDCLSYECTRSYGRSYEVPGAPSHLQKTLSWRHNIRWRNLTATAPSRTEREEIWRRTTRDPCSFVPPSPYSYSFHLHHCKRRSKL
jgi:hypothetical protein